MQCENPNFAYWEIEGLDTSQPRDIFEIKYDVNGCLIVCLERDSILNDRKEIYFDAPLAVRIANEGSLIPYWDAGFVVSGYNFFYATQSDFLDWLDSSSSGVHSKDRVTHYAIFTDDVAVEVLSTGKPVIKLRVND